MNLLRFKLKTNSAEHAFSAGFHPNHVSEMYEANGGYAVIRMVTGREYILDESINYTLDLWQHALAEL